jgi:transposase InsO family protein
MGSRGISWDQESYRWESWPSKICRGIEEGGVIGLCSRQESAQAAAEKLINLDFQAAAPSEKWPTDITEFQIQAGKLYLSPIIDCFDDLIISWSTGTHTDAELVNTMLDAAIETVADPDAWPIVHSEHGAHYRWPGWLSRMGDAKLVRSMSRKGARKITLHAKASLAG